MAGQRIAPIRGWIRCSGAMAPAWILAAAWLALAGSAGASPLVPRIVNGVETQAQPATGALLEPFGSGFRALCTGTLVGCETFLTAAHCVCPGDTFCTPDPADFAVYLQHSGIHTAASVGVHPAYEFGVAGDVAVVTISAPQSGIRPVPLNVTATPGSGTPGTIVGFGVTSGKEDDAGILREGQVTTGGCDGNVPEPEHVCWSFESPVGPPGQDSNTCFGDSGGPLFIDQGSGPEIAGITSGGFSAQCDADDLAFDANVFVYQGFIQGIGGADLGQTSCGAHSQVGDPDTTVAAFQRGALPGKAERRCRHQVRTQIRKYARSRHDALRKCIDRVQKGSSSGPCPDADTTARLQQIAARVDPARLDARCPAPVLAAAGLGGPCQSAQNGAELASCIRAAGDQEVDRLLDLAYADPAPLGPLADADEAACQRTIGKELSRYGHKRVSKLAACQAKVDRGKVGSCPDATSAAKIAGAAARAQDRLGRRCTDAQVASLDASAGFGGSCAGASSTAALAACGLPEHDASGDLWLGLVPGPPGSDGVSEFVVPVGTERLRVTVNGVDAAGNDLDLYVKQGSVPTPTDFHLSSSDSGVFEAVEQLSPTAGTWYLLVEEFGGAAVPYQATVTLFQP